MNVTRYYSQVWLQENPNRVAPHMDREISTMKATCLKRYFPNREDRQKVIQEFAAFTNHGDGFDDGDCIYDMAELEPKVWWITYGSAAPNLQVLALRLLGQPCSSSCCERNWSTYSFIHSLKRNKLTPARAEDLVFVHSNLRLLSRNSKNNEAERMWDLGGDGFESFDGVGILEIANLSLDEPDLEAVLFHDEDEQDTMVVSSN